MKMTEKTKKHLAIGGGAVICIALIAAIGLQFGKAPTGEDVLPGASSSATDIVIDPSSLSTETDGAETGPVIQPNTNATGSTGQATDSRPAQTDKTEQSIQSEVTKPADPEESVKTDPTKKPDGTKVDTPPTPVDHDSVVTPTEPEPSTNQPQGGETQNGKIYLPGFGWVTDTGSDGTSAGDMYENGNKIGSMD